MEGGEYRWVAEAVNHVVFADPGNTEARDLLADCFEQLGYQAEAGTWRNIYLSGAQELRDGIKKVAAPTAVSPELLAALPIEMIFDYLGVMLNGPRAAGTGQEHPAMTAAPVLLHEVLGVCAVAGQP